MRSSWKEHIWNERKSLDAQFSTLVKIKAAFVRQA